MRTCCLLIAFLGGLKLLAPSYADNLPSSQEIEADGAVIGEIFLEKSNVFDLSNPQEDKYLYRLANRLHIVTRDSTIRKQLLMKPGDSYSKRLAEESARILRQSRYLYDAEVKPIRLENGVVDLSVATRDLWTLLPEISLSRSGGENRTRFGIEEANLLGRGQLFRIVRDKDVDRTSSIFEFEDRNLGRTRVSTFLSYSDNSDGEKHLLSVVRPFYALDARWSAGGWTLGEEKNESLYSLGDPAAEYRQERDYATLFGGWSNGLQKGRTRRWTAGVVHDDSRFAEVADPSLPPILPSDRKLIYPFIALEHVEDQFEVSRNRDQISRTEDFLMGTYGRASIGWSDTSFGADRDALIYSARLSHGFGSIEKQALFMTAEASGRIESGNTNNSLLTLGARYYKTQGKKRLLFASISGTTGHALDLDNLVQLGGDTGLRGYPLRYQNGESKLLVTIEQRYFTDWYPWRLIRVGAAVFADAGRVWGQNPVGEPNLGWLKDVGVGLRFALTRSSSRKVIHFDLAFPLDGDPTIDDVQILLESRSSF
jgi:outer membrane protein assembly factor BamA